MPSLRHYLVSGCSCVVAATVGLAASGSALAQDGSGVQATREGAERFLQEALVRPEISRVNKPSRHWRHATKNNCNGHSGSNRGGCVWQFDISRVSSSDCTTAIFFKLRSEPDTDLKPEDRALKPAEKTDNLGMTIDWRTVKLSTFFDTDWQNNAIKVEGLASPWGTYWHPNFNIHLKDGSSDRVLKAMQYLQNACKLQSDTGF